MPSAFTPPSQSVTPSNTVTLTNKDIAKRVLSITSSATPSLSAADYDVVEITALAANITSITVSGSPRNRQLLKFSFKDNGTSRTITRGSDFVNGGGTMITATTINKETNELYEWSSAASKWVCLVSRTEA